MDPITEGKFKFQAIQEYIRGGFGAVDLTYSDEKQVCDSLAELAISTQNDRLVGSGLELEFVETVATEARRFFDGRISFKLRYKARRSGEGENHLNCESLVLYGLNQNQSIGFTILDRPPLPPPPPNPCYEMTDVVYNLYKDQVDSTDGFDVTDTFPQFLCGQIQPLNLTHKHAKDDCMRLTEIAVERFNEKFKDPGEKLRLVELVKAMHQGVNGTLYYITFKAVHQGVEQTCQTIVLSSHLKPNEVLCFRINPSDHEQGAWLWDHRQCGSNVGLGNA